MLGHDELLLLAEHDEALYAMRPVCKEWLSVANEVLVWQCEAQLWHLLSALRIRVRGEILANAKTRRWLLASHRLKDFTCCGTLYRCCLCGAPTRAILECDCHLQGLQPL